MIDRKLNYGRHLVDKFISQHCRRGFPAQVIIDLGAGHGDDLLIAGKYNVDAELFAIECWPPYVEELTNQGISVYSLNIESDPLPFADQSVDIVIANQILEHTKELFWIFHEATRVLKNGGVFIIGVPNLASLHNRLLLAFGRQPSPIKSASAHIRGFTKSDLLSFVDECFPYGYSLDLFGGSNFYPFPPLLAKPLSAAFPTLSWGIFLMLKKNGSYHREFLDYPHDKRLETNFYTG